MPSKWQNPQAHANKTFNAFMPNVDKAGHNLTDPVSQTDEAGPRPVGFWARVLDLYVGGFREMTVGRRLWAIILIKLAIMFLVFKLFFFPNKLQEEYDTDAERAAAVRTALTDTSRR